MNEHVLIKPHISVVSLFQELYVPFIQSSLIGKAQEKSLISVEIKALFSYVQPKERVDAPTFGHGSGMLIRPEVMERVINEREQAYGPALKIFFSPRGNKLTQPFLKSLAEQFIQKKHLLLLPARYEGMDARIEAEYADEIISVGDFVLMGGDIPAMMLMEGLLRFVPGVVGRQESVELDSFSGAFVDYPEYTAPVVWRGHMVPEVVRSGDHKKLQEWRRQQAVHSTVQDHFQWLRSSVMNDTEKKLAASFIPAHYVVLMHSQVLVEQGKEGTTSVTSIDLHDIARSAKTFGIKNVFIVTPLIDQQNIVTTVLQFWQTGHGVEYNKSRHDAVKSVKLKESLDAVIESIKEQEGIEPICIATSARSTAEKMQITFYDQQMVWKYKKPVLFVFGTGQGLASSVLQKADFVLLPVHGFSEYNHLSVRSAVAIILDRWLGISERLIPSLAKEDI